MRAAITDPSGPIISNATAPQRHDPVLSAMACFSFGSSARGTLEPLDTANGGPGPQFPATVCCHLGVRFGAGFLGRRRDEVEARFWPTREKPCMGRFLSYPK